MPRILSWLESELRGARDPVKADCIRAERACYLVRQGRIEEARETIRNLRLRYAAQPIDFVIAWINLTEGLVHHFEDMNSLAREKIQGAYDLSEASGQGDLIARTAAWLAQMAYLEGDFQAMVSSLRRSIQVAVPTNHAAQSRSSLVIAEAFHFAGQLKLAQPWYAKAQRHATAEGDDATISAHMHNMAWLRAANLRQTYFCGLVPTPAGDHALLSADSIVNFDQLVGMSSLQSLLPILRAQILSVLGDYPQALHLYENNLAAALKEGLSRMHSNLLSDQAWCRLKSGQMDAAKRDAIAAEALLSSTTHHDDKANTHSRLTQLFDAIGDSTSAEKHALSARAAWSQHTQLQQRTVSLLRPLTEAVSG